MFQTELSAVATESLQKPFITHKQGDSTFKYKKVNVYSPSTSVKFSCISTSI